MDTATQQYRLITLNYWAFTITDGALRMLVILYFHQLGYSAVELASVFFLYELCGVITNLVGGWLATRMGLNTTMHYGLALQILALSLLLVDSTQLSVLYVMMVQAISGMAKDLNKTSAKSSLKLLAPKNRPDKLYRWVALLTGSKNTLKGMGFFLGAWLLTVVGFKGAVASMALGLLIILLFSLIFLKKDLGIFAFKPKFMDIFSPSQVVNRLSAARFFLFGSRDIWFVIALPAFLQEQLGWEYTEVGILLAIWVIAYGLVQSLTPLITGGWKGKTPDGKSALFWVLLLAIIPFAIAAVLYQGQHIEIGLIIGLLVYGIIFAINSAVHSYLIVDYAKEEGVSLDIGFYYMANALGRLVGTLLSGWIYQTQGLVSCLLLSGVFIIVSGLISMKLPK